MTLTAPWTFSLIHEKRNKTLIAGLGLEFNGTGYGTLVRYPEGNRWVFKEDTATLPTGTTLKVDRIYIRKGGGDFDSVTFYVESTPLALKPIEVEVWDRKAKANVKKTRNVKQRF